MYWKLFLSTLEGKLGSLGKQNLMRSGMVTGMVIGLLVVGAAIAYFESGKGHLHRLEEHLAPPQEQEAAPPRPGGQDPVILSRSPVPGGLFPEFLSATLLPGRGMDVLQISAYLPEKGEVNLLASTDVPGAVRAMTGVDDDYAGAANLTDGGTFLVPWAGASGWADLDRWEERDRYFSEPDLQLAGEHGRERCPGCLWRHAAECAIEQCRSKYHAGWRVGDSDVCH